MMEIEEFDNRHNFSHNSRVPHATKSEPCCLGIDEAGRGPVLGPVVYGACYCPLSQNSTLKSMGFADSKTLTEEQREDLFTKLNESTDIVGWMVDVLSPSYISRSMLKRVKYNLNQVSHDTAIGLIHRALNFGVHLTEVYIDTVGDPTAYENKLKEIFPALEITVAKKADSTYSIVSAASICAKVMRDRVVSKWKFSEDVYGPDMEYGSGYPSDPKTKEFLASTLDPIFGFTQFVRFSWSTADVIIKEKGVQVHWEDDEDEQSSKKKPDLKNVPSITSFFQSSDTDSAKSIAASHRFFSSCCLKRSLKL